MNKWTTHTDIYEETRRRMAEFAARNGCILNPDEERVEKVIGLMTENIVATGKGYCPCKQSHPLEPAKDVICPCPTWQDEVAAEGHCFCRLFYRSEETK